MPRSFIARDSHGIMHRVDGDLSSFATFDQCFLVARFRRDRNGTTIQFRPIDDLIGTYWELDERVITCLECATRPFSICGYDWPRDHRAIKRQ